MGLLQEEVSKGTMPQAPTPKSVKKIEDFPKDSDGDVINGKGYKKEVFGLSTVVYDGNFKNNILQNGVVYGFEQSANFIVETERPFTKDNAFITFSEKTSSWSYYNEKLSETLIGQQKLRISSNSLGVFDIENTKVEYWYFDHPITFYYKGTTTNTEKNNQTLIDGNGNQYIGNLKSEGGSILETFYDNSVSKLNFTDGEKKIPDILNVILGDYAKQEELKKQEDLKKQEELKKQEDLKKQEVEKVETKCEGNCKDGQGILTYQNGNIMSGTFSGGKLNGSGKFTDAERKFKVTGNFVNGVLNGEGIIRFTDGKTYKGTITSDETLNKISVQTRDGQTIDDVVVKHRDETYEQDDQITTHQFILDGDVYFLNKLQTKTPIVNAKIIVTKYENKELTNKISTTYTDKNGKFNIKLDRGYYKVDADSNNQFFKSASIESIKLYNNTNKNFVLEKTRRAEKSEDDFINIGTMTIFNNPVNFENKIHNKSDNKLEYCKRFTNYYYKVVIEKGGELSTLNNNNLINAKNFVINCYKEYVTKYDNKMVNKIKKLSNLGGNIEVFEL